MLDNMVKKYLSIHRCTLKLDYTYDYIIRHLQLNPNIIITLDNLV